VLLILAPVDGGEPLHLCGICGFVLRKPGEPCPRYALINEDVAAVLDSQRVAESVEERLKDQGGKSLRVLQVNGNPCSGPKSCLGEGRGGSVGQGCAG
jgi:hypothetical protein